MTQLNAVAGRSPQRRDFTRRCGKPLLNAPQIILLAACLHIGNYWLSMEVWTTGSCTRVPWEDTLQPGLGLSP